MDADLLRELSVVEQEAMEDVAAPAAEADGPDESTAAIDAELARGRRARDARGIGMHSRRRQRLGKDTGAKAVLADKRAHDLDESIARRRADAALSDRLMRAAYGAPSGGAGPAEPLHAVPASRAEDSSDDDDALAAIRRRRLDQLRQAASAPVGTLVDFASQADMGEALERDRRDAADGMAPRWRVVHLSEPWHAGCRAVDAALARVAGAVERAGEAGVLSAPVSLCRIGSGVAIPGFDPDGLPALAVYRGGLNAEQLLGVLGGEDAASAATVSSVAGLLSGCGVPMPELGVPAAS